jgi:putative membrane protein insertion efficiency factor
LRVVEIPKQVLFTLIRAYKYAVSPLFLPACRYVPSCSEYAMEALDRHGALRGGTMAIARILRCHPFTRGGFDPVPLDCRVARALPSALSPVENIADRSVRATSAHTCTSH